MRVLLILLLLAVIAHSILTKRGIIEGKKNNKSRQSKRRKKKAKIDKLSRKERKHNAKKAVKNLSTKDRRRRFAEWGVSGANAYAYARNDKIVLEKKFEDKPKYLKGKTDRFKSAFWKVYKNFYKHRRFVFDKDGNHVPNPDFTTNAYYGQYQMPSHKLEENDDGIVKCIAEKNCKDKSQDFRRFRKTNENWHDLIYNLILPNVREKKQRMDKKEKEGGWASKMFGSKEKNKGMSKADLTAELSGYVTTDTLNDYAKSDDLKDYAKSSDLDDYVTTTGLSDTLVKDPNAIDDSSGDYLFKTFILTQNESGLDSWINDKDAAARKELIQDKYEQHIRFFNS